MSTKHTFKGIKLILEMWEVIWTHV